MYKNIICFFSFLFIIGNVCMGKVREIRRWLILHTHTHTHIQGLTVRIFSDPLPPRSVRVEIFLGLYNFPDAHEKVTPPTYILHLDMSPSRMPPTQLKRHFRRGISVLFTLGNRGISCYANKAIYTAYRRDLQVNIQHQYSTKKAVEYEDDGDTNCN